MYCYREWKQSTCCSARESWVATVSAFVEVVHAEKGMIQLWWVPILTSIIFFLSQYHLLSVIKNACNWIIHWPHAVHVPYCIHSWSPHHAMVYHTCTCSEWTLLTGVSQSELHISCKLGSHTHITDYRWVSQNRKNLLSSMFIYSIREEYTLFDPSFPATKLYPLLQRPCKLPSCTAVF